MKKTSRNAPKRGRRGAVIPPARPRTPRALFTGDRLYLQSIMLKVPLATLAKLTGIAPRKLVEFGNGTATPTVKQAEAIYGTVFVELLIEEAK